jgi:phosphopantothenoylcysteine decarboxylase/phosphopantothenate--cysteine ligase
VTSHSITPPSARAAPRAGSTRPDAPRLLITAGPTHEPLDAVRYIGNRSSGRLGIALARAAADRGFRTTLLLGPTQRDCSDTHAEVHRFQTTADLEGLLETHFPQCDALVMAAAVADYRPNRNPEAATTKLRRTDAKLTLELEPTPDLLAGCAERRRDGQLVVGFALEPRAELEASAKRKLARKKIDAIVANPLETMVADEIEATIYTADGQAHATPGRIPKTDFAPWLLEQIAALLPTG